jgi:hypothetical protein
MRAVAEKGGGVDFTVQPSQRFVFGAHVHILYQI